MTTTSSPAVRRRSLRFRVAMAGVATVTASALCAPAMAPADPLIPPDSLTFPTIPYDSELAAAVKALKAAGVDQMAVQAAQAIIKSLGQISTQQAAARVGRMPTAGGSDPLTVLKQLGIQPMTPSVAPFCSAPTADNPLGLVTAGAGAVPGPWPLKQDPTAQVATPLKTMFGVTLPKMNAVERGQTAYAFVPATTQTGSGAQDKMQVAWFNTSTMQGGFADLHPVSNSPLVAALPLLSGVRLAPVDTGSGTVLAAVFGNAHNGSRSCYFLPAVGVVNAP